ELPDARALGMAVVRALVPNTGNARVLLGLEPPTERATVAVVLQKKLLWRAPATDLPASYSVEFLSPPIAAVRQERLVVPFTFDNPAGGGVACFALDSGRRLWKVIIPSWIRPGGSGDIMASRDGQVFFRNAAGRVRVMSLG